MRNRGTPTGDTNPPSRVGLGLCARGPRGPDAIEVGDGAFERRGCSQLESDVREPSAWRGVQRDTPLPIVGLQVHRAVGARTGTTARGRHRVLTRHGARRHEPDHLAGEGGELADVWYIEPQIAQAS